MTIAFDFALTLFILRYAFVLASLQNGEKAKEGQGHEDSMTKS